MKPTESIRGQQFGLLKAVSFAGYFAPNLGSCRLAYWNCRCKCGKIVRVRAGDLKSGRRKSCGCLKGNRSRNTIDVVGVTTKSQFSGEIMAYKHKSDAVKYNNEYNKRAYDRINLTVPKGYREVIREAANANGESVNEFILRLIKGEIENTKA